MPWQLALLAGLLQFAVTLPVYLRLSPREHIVWRDVPDRAVQPDMVIAIYILLNQALRVFQRQRRSRPNAFAFQRLVPAFQLAIRLRVAR